MKILVACEESQAVTKELRALGHEAYSCDIIDQSGGHPEWHIMQDVLPLLNGRCSFATTDGAAHAVVGKWDMIIAFPPCTHLAVSGAQWFGKKRADGRQREGVEFFCRFLSADCDRIVIENPVGIIGGDYVREHFPDLADLYGLPLKPTQIIQPWMFGNKAKKTTCLWIKGLEPLRPEITEEPELEYFEWIKDGKKKRQPLWYYEALSKKNVGKAQSKTFPGIARAMAAQWAGPAPDAGVWIDWPSCEYICSACGRSSECVKALPTCPNCGSPMRTGYVCPSIDCFAEDAGAYPAWWTTPIPENMTEEDDSWLL